MEEGIDDSWQNKSYSHLLKHPILSHSEERKTLELVAKGDATAREKMVLHNLRLVYSIAAKVSSSLPFDDRFQAGIEGAYKALSKFDLSKGERFSTYAIWWIRQSIQRASSESSLLKLPENAKELLRDREQFCTNYLREHNAYPNADLIKTHLQKNTRQRVSDTVLEFVSTYNGTYLSNLLDFSPPPNIHHNSVENEVIEHMSSLEIQSILEKILTFREHTILMIRYGLSSKVNPEDLCLTRNNKVPLKTIAEKFGYTRERIRQIESEALRKLKEYFEQELHDRSDSNSI